MSFRITFCFLAAICLPVTRAEPITIHGQQWNITIDPSTLAVSAKPMLADAITVSCAREKAAKVSDFVQHDHEIEWKLPDEGIVANFKLMDDVLQVQFIAEKPGNFTWPVISGTAAPKAYILPMLEGLYVPGNDVIWADFLAKQGPFDTTAGLSMPFFAIDASSDTVTYILTNPFNNALEFSRDKKHVSLKLTHEFTRNHKVKEFGYQIHLGDSSPITPALIYRDHLVAAKQFVPLAGKIAKTPDVEKLLGAAHVYLWGDGLITRGDIKDYRTLARKLVESNPGKRLLSLMSAEHIKLINELCNKQWIDPHDKGQVVEELDLIFHRRDLYQEAAWSGVTLPEEAKELIKIGIAKMSDAQVVRLNSLLFAAAYFDLLSPVDSWGDGYSTKMLKGLADAGLDRLWLGSPSWKGLADHPAFTAHAIAQGYLIGPYDSYHSIHSPGEKETWETAQFDQKLYDAGTVTNADGSKKKGFKQKGFVLNCAAARPYVEARVTRLMEAFKCNSWFMDCDAFGEVFDDYSPEHPATQEDDQNARVSRLKWIADQFHAVVGSEGGSAYAAPAIHFAHGIMTPVIGWGDPDLMKDAKSKYFLGKYYPPDAPTMFFTQVPMKDEYRRAYVDPRFRLPLYEVVFHDSVIATHQWGSASLKFEDPDHTRELLELLYNVPPMYHLNLAELGKRRAEIKSHYDFWSPIHRETATVPMTEFEWLDDEHLIQRTRFGDELEMLANFSDDPYALKRDEVPPHSIRATWLKSEKQQVYPEKK